MSHPSAARGPADTDQRSRRPARSSSSTRSRRSTATASCSSRRPTTQLPEHGMRAVDAMRLIGEELVLDGIPMRNLATFVTTWMEPEAQRIIAENLHRNFIDHAEYPQTAEIEQRCIRMLADLFHAPGETTGARTQGSSEAIMLGALSLKWKWRKRREEAGKATDRPNLVFGGDVHVVWEKFCRYFDVEPRIIPLQPDKYTIGPEDVEPHVDENTIGVAAVLGTTFTGHADDIVGHQRPARPPARREGARRPAARRRGERRLRVAVPLPRLGVGLPARAGALDQRLGPQVRARLPGHRLADLPREERPRRGPRVLRELPRQDGRDVHAELLDRLGDGAGPVLQLRPLRARRLPLHHGDDAGQRARRWPSGSSDIGEFELVGDDGAEQLPLVAFQLDGRAQLRRVRRRLAAGRRARLDGARLHAAAERAARHDHARARQADAQPHAREHARRRHRPGVRDARQEGRPAPASTASAPRPAPATDPGRERR